MLLTDTTPGMLKDLTDARELFADQVIDERRLDDVDGPALLRLFTSLPAKHPSRATVRARAIEAWLPLATSLANRFANRGETHDDLTQTATIGLIKAVDRFDPTRGVEFAAYAVPTIVGEIKRHFRDHTWDVRVPRRIQELRLQVAEAANTLTNTLHREPTPADIATHLGITETDVRDGLTGAGAYNAISLQTPTRPGTDSGGEIGDLLGDTDPDLDLTELRATLAPALATLDERERRILGLRFYHNMTQSQIADQIGVSQMHVSRLLTRALTKLRGELDPTV
ncbi:SigB/SigF/SigG family RNA polymerase sigma factor [Luedemannella flava]